MKKILPILLIAVLALTCCSDKNPNAGKYTGTYTFVTNNITTGGSLRLMSNPLTTGLLVYGVIPIEAIGSNMYASSADNSALVTKLLQQIGNQSNIYNTATEQIKNVKVEATFSGNTVQLDLYYEVALISDLLQTRISIVKFSGAKE